MLRASTPSTATTPSSSNHLAIRVACAMATPFSTPRYPGAPNPTPRSTGKVPRAPIHNPYDKFTQPEFDAWIGDITGALKRALGRDDAPPIPTSSARAQRHSPEEEDSIEDSFAEVRARRLAKGKERAREEDYEEEDVHHQHGEGTWYGASEEEEEDEYGSSSEEDEEEAWRRPMAPNARRRAGKHTKRVIVR